MFLLMPAKVYYLYTLSITLIWPLITASAPLQFKSVPSICGFNYIKYNTFRCNGVYRIWKSSRAYGLYLWALRSCMSTFEPGMQKEEFSGNQINATIL